jgi:hypothetical protein
MVNIYTKKNTQMKKIITIFAILACSVSANDNGRTLESGSFSISSFDMLRSDLENLNTKMDQEADTLTALKTSSNYPALKEQTVQKLKTEFSDIVEDLKIATSENELTQAEARELAHTLLIISTKFVTYFISDL